MNDDEFKELMKGKKSDEKKALLREYVQGRQVQIHMEFFKEQQNLKRKETKAALKLE